MTLWDEMRDYAWWMGRRDELVTRALAQGIPAIRIATEMGLNVKAVYRIRDQLQPEGSIMESDTTASGNGER